MASINRRCLADNKTCRLPTAASTTIEVGDLCYWDDSNNVAKPLTSLTTGATEALDQQSIAEQFCGVALNQRLSSETTTGDNSRRDFSADGIFLFPCPSTTWEIGDLVGVSWNGGSALANQVVAKVTEVGRAIGVCVERTTGAVTQVRVRLLSVWDSDIRHSVADRFATHMSASTEWIATSVDKVFWVAPRPCKVKFIRARVTVAGTDGSAVTAVVGKVASGTAIGSGTALHTGSINLKGTADTNQSLTLSTTPATLELATGDALYIDFTGTLTSATGVVTVGLQEL